MAARSFEWFKIPVNFNTTNQFWQFCRALNKDAATSAGVLVGVWAIAARELPDGDLGGCSPGWIASQVGYKSPKDSLKDSYGRAITQALVTCKYASPDLKLFLPCSLDGQQALSPPGTLNEIKPLPEPPSRERRGEDIKRAEEKRAEAQAPNDDATPSPPFKNFPFTRGQVKRMAKELALPVLDCVALLRAVDSDMDLKNISPPVSKRPESIYDNLKKLAMIQQQRQTKEKGRHASTGGKRFD